jgi:hypothetical protein
VAGRVVAYISYEGMGGGASSNYTAKNGLP